MQIQTREGVEKYVFPLKLNYYNKGNLLGGKSFDTIDVSFISKYVNTLNIEI